jgi:DNA-binding NarL/FixJ family response regulator
MNMQFTIREREIIRAICEGSFCDKELGQALNISANTVSVHLQHIYEKLRDQFGREDVTRMDVVIYAMLAGYADTDKLREKYSIPDERLAASAPM